MKSPSRRALEELSALQGRVQALGGPRNLALRIFATSRRSTTLIAQREFWLEFAWLDQEYRDAVRRLAQFCARPQAWLIPQSAYRLSHPRQSCDPRHKNLQQLSR